MKINLLLIFCIPLMFGCLNAAYDDYKQKKQGFIQKIKEQFGTKSEALKPSPKAQKPVPAVTPTATPKPPTPGASDILPPPKPRSGFFSNWFKKEPATTTKTVAPEPAPQKTVAKPVKREGVTKFFGDLLKRKTDSRHAEMNKFIDDQIKIFQKKIGGPGSEYYKQYINNFRLVKKILNEEFKAGQAISDKAIVAKIQEIDKQMQELEKQTKFQPNQMRKLEDKQKGLAAALYFLNNTFKDSKVVDEAKKAADAANKLTKDKSVPDAKKVLEDLEKQINELEGKPAYDAEVKKLHTAKTELLQKYPELAPTATTATIPKSAEKPATEKAITPDTEYYDDRGQFLQKKPAEKPATEPTIPKLSQEGDKVMKEAQNWKPYGSGFGRMSDTAEKLKTEKMKYATGSPEYKQIQKAEILLHLKFVTGGFDRTVSRPDSYETQPQDKFLAGVRALESLEYLKNPEIQDSLKEVLAEVEKKPADHGINMDSLKEGMKGSEKVQEATLKFRDQAKPKHGTPDYMRFEAGLEKIKKLELKPSEEQKAVIDFVDRRKAEIEKALAREQEHMEQVKASPEYAKHTALWVEKNEAYTKVVQSGVPNTHDTPEYKALVELAAQDPTNKVYAVTGKLADERDKLNRLKSGVFLRDPSIKISPSEMKKKIKQLESEAKKLTEKFDLSGPGKGTSEEFDAFNERQRKLDEIKQLTEAIEFMEKEYKPASVVKPVE